MGEGEPRGIEAELSQEEWTKKVEEITKSDLGTKIIIEFDRIYGEGEGLFKLWGMNDEIAKRANITAQELSGYAAYHIIIGSTPDYNITPKIDLPGNRIENTINYLAAS